MPPWRRISPEDIIYSPLKTGRKEAVVANKANGASGSRKPRETLDSLKKERQLLLAKIERLKRQLAEATTEEMDSIPPLVPRDKETYGPNALGERIEQLRNELTLSYRDLAERVLQSGGDITEGTIRNVVRGTMPTLATLYSLSLALAPHVTFVELLELAGVPIDQDEMVTEFVRQLARIPQPQRSEMIRGPLWRIVYQAKSAQDSPGATWLWVVDPLFPRAPAPVFRGGLRGRAAGGDIVRGWPGAKGENSHENTERQLRLEADWKDMGTLSTDLTVRLVRLGSKEPVAGVSIVLYPMGNASAGIERITDETGQAEFKGLVSARPDKFRLEIRGTIDSDGKAVGTTPKA